MLVRTSHVIGLNIFSIEEGKNLNQVDDVIYDASTQRIHALLCKSTGLFTEGKAIRIEDVKSIGEDAVVIQSESLIRRTSDLNGKAQTIAKDDTFLTKTTVMSEDGNELGKVTDLLFDPDTGKVEELEVSQGGLRNLQSGKKRIKPEHITTVGKDALIVSTYTEAAFEEQGEQGGLQGALYRARQNTQDAFEGAREKWESPEVQNRIETAKMDIASATEEGKQQLEYASDQVRSKIDEARHDPSNRQKVEEWQDQAKDLSHQAMTKADELKSSAQQSFTEARGKVEEQKTTFDMNKENDAVGQYITRNILDQNDRLIARRGEMVTHNIIDKAKQSGTIESVMHSLSTQPLMTSGALGGEVERDHPATYKDDDIADENIQPT